MKRILSAVLALAMLMGLLPMLTLPAAANAVIPISTEDQLRALPVGIASWGNTYTLVNDIDLTLAWIPIDNFMGTLDGGGYTISNLRIPESDNRQNAGLFGVLSGGSVTIRNLGIRTAAAGVNARTTSARDKTNAGIFVGFAGGSVSLTIRQSFADGVVWSYNRAGTAAYNSAAYAGGFIGQWDSTGILRLEDCFARGEVTAFSQHTGVQSSNSRSGGLIGLVNRGSTIIGRCYTANSVLATPQGSRRAGDLIGYPDTNSISIVNSVRANSFVTDGGTLSLLPINRRFTDPQMRDGQNFQNLGWDFEKIWLMPDNEFPRLRMGECFVCDKKPCECVEPPCHECNRSPCACCNGCCIDYSNSAEGGLVLHGKTFSFKSGKQIPADAEHTDDVSISLTDETITFADGFPAIEAYSTDGGVKWKAGSLTDAQVAKLLNKGMELWLCYKNYNSNAKKPQGSGNEHNIVAFPKINERPKAPKLTINYALAADTNGKSLGAWVLSEKGGSKAVRDKIEIGIPVMNGNKLGKTVNNDGFGRFYDDRGICVKPLTGTKPERSAYFIRIAPEERANGTYTAAGRHRRIRASGELKAPRYKINIKGETAAISVRANTYVTMNGTTTPYTTKTPVNVLNAAGNIEIWQGATVRKPASAKQILTR